MRDVFSNNIPLGDRYIYIYICLLQSNDAIIFMSIGSHNIDGDENSENKDHYSQTIPWLDQQARYFTDEQDEYHMSLTRVMVDSFAITLWQTMSL